MMKHVAPRADLPAMSHDQPVSKRSNKASQRNMTGIYLGMEGTQGAAGARYKTAVPPLARGRGVPRRARTPTEQRRYANLLAALESGYPITVMVPGHDPSIYGDLTTIPCLPHMPLSRYPLLSRQKMVELLRIKEERRGFTGRSLRKRTSDRDLSPDSPRRSAHANIPRTTEVVDDVTFWDITKKTARNMTPTTSVGGVPRLENLQGAPPGMDGLGSEALALEVQRLAVENMSRKELTGLVECYKKVCKGNINALQGLMPNQRPVNEQHPTSSIYHYTGFAVKSYRNPNQAEIFANFPSVEPPRPRTVMINTPSTRSYVPSPYFFKSYSPPKTGSSGKGALESSVTDGRQSSNLKNSRPLDDAEGLGVVTQAPPTMPKGQTEHQPEPATQSQDTKVEISLPGVDHAVEAESVAASSQVGDRETIPGSAITRAEPPAPPSQPAEPPSGETENQPIPPPPPSGDTQSDAVKSDEPAAADKTFLTNPPDYLPGESENTNNNHILEEDNTTDISAMLEQSENAPQIHVGLVDEQGETIPIEIDETDDALQKEGTDICAPEGIKRRVSISEKVLKNADTQQQLASLSEGVKNRKEELAELLSEHAQIVREVITMEGGSATSPGSDKENNSFVLTNAPTQSQADKK